MPGPFVAPEFREAIAGAIGRRQLHQILIAHSALVSKCHHSFHPTKYKLRV